MQPTKASDGGEDIGAINGRLVEVQGKITKITDLLGNGDFEAGLALLRKLEATEKGLKADLETAKVKVNELPIATAQLDIAERLDGFYNLIA